MTAQTTPFVLLRHGPTDWNREKRLQGRSDTLLSRAGREIVAGWRLPNDLADYRWLVSPLRRARETADILGLGQAKVEAALIEMDWGDWEGEVLETLRQSLGEEMARSEAMGLDLRPPGGESPRDVQARLRPLLQRIGQEGQPTAAVCHRGVIRALHALASGWDMTGKPPVKLLNNCLHRFILDEEGRPEVVALNESLLPEDLDS